MILLKPIGLSLCWLFFSAAVFLPLALKASNPHAGMMLYQSIISVAVLIAAAPWLSTNTRLGKLIRSAIWPFDLIGERGIQKLAYDRSLANVRSVLKKYGFDSDLIILPYCYRILALAGAALMASILIDLPFPQPQAYFGLWIGAIIGFQALPMLYLAIAIVIARSIARSTK